jgi:hypothetical protein
MSLSVLRGVLLGYLLFAVREGQGWNGCKQAKDNTKF